MAKHFAFNLIKAHLSESIIKHLFIENGYKVFHYGMEAAVPTIVGLLNTDTSDVSKSIRQMPDFVVQAPTGNLFYLEVKYRASGKFESSELMQGFPYHNAWFIIVSKKEIFCISYSELLELEKLPTTNAYKLGNRNAFALSGESVAYYRDMIQRFYEGGDHALLELLLRHTPSITPNKKKPPNIQLEGLLTRKFNTVEALKLRSHSDSILSCACCAATYLKVHTPLVIPKTACSNLNALG